MADPTTTSMDDASVAELLTQLSEQTSRLVRDEMMLARVEMTEKAKHVGVGAGLFSAAGLLAVFGLGTLITTAILALALTMSAWLAALIVTVVLFAIAGVVALLGKKEIAEGTPPAPKQAIASIKSDVEEVKEARHRDDVS